MSATATGIDVAAKYKDIRLITLKHFRVAGVDPEELVQEVCLGIVQRNRSPGSAFDPARGAFSTYVFRVGQNVAARLATREGKQSKIREALREELMPARSSLGGATVEWAAALDGGAIQLSLFGWEPVEIATTRRRAPVRKTRARAQAAHPGQLQLFARAA